MHWPLRRTTFACVSGPQKSISVFCSCGYCSRIVITIWFNPDWKELGASESSCSAHAVAKAVRVRDTARPDRCGKRKVPHSSTGAMSLFSVIGRAGSEPLTVPAAGHARTRRGGDRVRTRVGGQVRLDPTIADAISRGPGRRGTRGRPSMEALPLRH